MSLEDYKRAYREIRVDEEKQGFQIHLVIYILVNLLLIVINLIYSPQQIWFIYPLVGWGIGIILHYLYSVYWVDKELKKLEAEAEYRAREYRT